MGTILCAKATEYLCFGFCHAQITFGLGVIKWDICVGDKPEMFDVVFYQSSQELHIPRRCNRVMAYEHNHNLLSVTDQRGNTTT